MRARLPLSRIERQEKERKRCSRTPRDVRRKKRAGKCSPPVNTSLREYECLMIAFHDSPSGVSVPHRQMHSDKGRERENSVLRLLVLICHGIFFRASCAPTTRSVRRSFHHRHCGGRPRIPHGPFVRHRRRHQSSTSNEARSGEDEAPSRFCTARFCNAYSRIIDGIVIKIERIPM